MNERFRIEKLRREVRDLRGNLRKSREDVHAAIVE
jgi:hypothetical protein